jgi:cell division protein FtsI/penicillin-binding protein 2
MPDGRRRVAVASEGNKLRQALQFRPLRQGTGLPRAAVGRFRGHKRGAVFNVVVVLVVTSMCRAWSLQAKSTSAALEDALRGTQASAVVLDTRSGAVLASVGPVRNGLPGSTLKPMLLEYALEHGIVQPETQVYCRRDLHIGLKVLPCTHPSNEPVFTAESALAESCNTWFAELGRRYTGVELETVLRAAGIPHSLMDGATADERQLAVLGLDGISVSTIELARAYRKLMIQAPADGVVMHGLKDSVEYGMANQARVAGVNIVGKTGTASDAGESWTHGWFAGAVPGRLVLIVYVPHGDGGTAAKLAQSFFRTMGEDPRR